MRKTAMITGANRGIGFEMSRQLCTLGFDVIMAGRNRQHLDDAIDHLGSEGLTAQAVILDLEQRGSIREAASAFAKTGRRLDVLINNGAIMERDDKSLLSWEMSEIERAIQINSLAALEVIRVFRGHLNSPARIVNISSGGGAMNGTAAAWAPAYCISKTLLNAITRQLDLELAPQGIAVNAVCPGWVKTRMGGSGAPRSVAQGADTPVWLATEAPLTLSGHFIRDREVIPW